MLMVDFIKSPSDNDTVYLFERKLSNNNNMYKIIKYVTLIDDVQLKKCYPGIIYSQTIP